MKCSLQAVLVLLLSLPAGAYGFAQQTAAQAPATSPSQAPHGTARAANPVRPAHPITLEQTREMFQLMHFRSAMQNMLHANLEEQKQRAPFIPQDVWKDFEESYAKVDFVRLFLPIYQKYLSQEEAAKALDFYRTPAGQHTLAVMPPLMQDIARASQKQGEEIASQVFERHRQEIEDAQKKYGQPAAPPTNTPSGEDHSK